MSKPWDVPEFREDRRAPAAARDVRCREVPRLDLTDPIELACPAGCVPEWRDGRWSHQRSCLMRGRALGGGGGASVPG